MTQPTLFNPLDQSTWPEQDKPYLWFYSYDNQVQAVVATFRHEVRKFDGSEYIWFDVCGVDGYEYECDLNGYPPFAYSQINFPTEPTNAN